MDELNEICWNCKNDGGCFICDDSINDSMDEDYSNMINSQD